MQSQIQDQEGQNERWRKKVESAMNDDLLGCVYFFPLSILFSWKLHVIVS